MMNAWHVSRGVMNKSKLSKYGKRAGLVVAALVALDLLAGVATVAFAAWLKP